MFERTKARGCVVVAGFGVVERTHTVGRVLGAAGVVIERLITDGRVADAGACEFEERTVTLSRSLVGIASVRCWTYRSHRRGKRTADEHERDENKTAPQRPPAHPGSYGYGASFWIN